MIHPLQKTRIVPRFPIALLRLILLVAICLVDNFCQTVGAGVVVLNNRTNKPVLVSVQSSFETTTVSLEPTSSRPFFSEESLWVAYRTASETLRQQVDLGSIYYFTSVKNCPAGKIALREISLGSKKKKPALVKKKPNQLRVDLPGSNVIHLMVYVDEEELMTISKWKDRLRKRVATASEIIRQHSGMPVVLVGYGRWQSDNRLNDFSAILADFENKVTPPEGVVAFGFTSQLELHRRGKRRLGGTRGPLRDHLLVREWAPQIAENERIEVLVHELGHYLGASHSPEPTSVMRPTLGGSNTRLKSKRIQFDPLNTFAMAIVGEELQSRKVNQFEAISPANRILLASVYKTLKEALPDDPSSATLYKRASRNLGGKAEEVNGLEALVRLCLTEVTRVAAENRKRPVAKLSTEIEANNSFPASNASGLLQQVTNDELTNLYVKTIATTVAASRLPADEQQQALIYTIPLAMDRSAALNRFGFFKELSKAADPQRQRQMRMNLIGQPTARQRNDSLLHFAISAALTIREGEAEARFWGYAKEAFDSLPDGSGFSFTDIAADEAGIRFAKALIAGTISPKILAERFDIAHFMPSIEGLPEGLRQEEFIAKYGGKDDARYSDQLNKINRRINLLPPYFRFTTILPIEASVPSE